VLEALSEKEASVEEILAHASDLEEQIKTLQRLIESYSDALLNVRIAKQINDSLKQGELANPNLIISGDKRANILLKATLVESRPIVHIGLNLYVEADHDLALKILDAKEKILSGQLDRIKKEYDQRVKEYKKLQDFLYAVSQRTE
jgi:prefoldin subunit 5